MAKTRRTSAAALDANPPGGLDDEVNVTLGSSKYVVELPTVDPEHLADLLWTMHCTKGQREAIYP